MTRDDAKAILMDLVEQVQATPAVHRQFFEAIEVLAATPSPEQNGSGKPTRATK